MITSEELAAIRKRADAATDGPWHVNMGMAYCVRTGDGPGKMVSGTGSNEPDANFIARARTDVTALLDEVERLHKVGSYLLGTTHGWQERAEEAEARITELESINAGLRKWQDVARPKLEDEVHSLKHLLMRACGEIFGGVVMRPFMIEELRKHHVVEEDSP